MLPNPGVWLIYGANGYTGELIAEAAVARGLKPILAGRNKASCEALATRLNLPLRIFSLNDPQAISAGLEGVSVVVNCAGPFSQTARLMLEGCLKAKTHYLDITGEIEVFELIFSKQQEITKANILALSGVGFDVVPSDCLAALLARRLREIGGDSPHSLDLAFRTTGGVSRGTFKTMLEKLPHGSKERREGKLIATPWGKVTRYLTFAKERGMSIPWGDVSTAFYSTGTPNIRVFVPANKTLINFMRGINLSAKILPWTFIVKFLQTLVDVSMHGPKANARSQHKTELWGEISDIKGQKAEAILRCGDGYDVTVWTALACLEKALSPFDLMGPQTPSQFLGAEGILAIPGVKLEWLKI